MSDGPAGEQLAGEQPAGDDPAAAAQRTRLKVFGVLLTYMIAGYFVIGRLNLHRDHYWDVALPFEEQIPFVPQLIVAYALVYFVVLVGAMRIPLMQLAYFRRAARWLALNFHIAFVIFLLFPVAALHRPPIDPEASVWLALTGFYYDFDAPTNLLPSLHVQMALMGGLLCWRHGGLTAAVGLLSALTVSVSVVLLKQHYVADIAAAALIVWGTARYCGMDFRPGEWPDPAAVPAQADGRAATR